MPYLNAYLARYAESFDPTALPKLPEYDSCLIVPAFDEEAAFLDRLLPRNAKNLLVIVVVNAPADAPVDQIQRTRKLLVPGQARFALRVRDEQNRVGELVCNLVDSPLNPKQAVGLARKFGNDLACHLIAQGVVRQPFLCNTDADAQLPDDYFRRVTRGFARARADCGVAIMPFRHTSERADFLAAGDSYELSVRYIARALGRCRCPYDYPALGSTLVIQPEAYAKVRGFPPRAAGEDFYLLNKLAKVSSIAQLSGAPILVQARPSHRVPFGTGPAIEKILQAANGTTNTLKKWPEQFHRGANPTAYDCVSYADESYVLLAHFYTGYNELRIPNKGGKPKPPIAWRDPDLAFLLKNLGFQRSFQRIAKNSSTNLVLHRAMHEWFDGLKVIRFLNAARHFYKDQPVLPRAQKELGRMGDDARTLTQLSEANRQPSNHGIAVLIDNHVAQSRDFEQTDV